MLMLLRDTRNSMQKCSCFPSPSLMTLAAGERERSKSNRLPSFLFLRRRAKAAQTSFFIPPSSPLLLLNSHSPSTAFVWISWNGGGGGGERSACCRFPYFYFHPTVRSSEKVYRSYVKKVRLHLLEVLNIHRSSLQYTFMGTFYSTSKLEALKLCS